MRKLELIVYFDIHFKPKGDKGDKVKKRVNNILKKSIESLDEIVRYEITGSRRDYSSNRGTIITKFKAYIKDGVNLYKGEYPSVNEGDVDVINNKLWHKIADYESGSMGRKKDWSLGDVSTNKIEHVNSSVDEDKRIEVDLDDRYEYMSEGGKSPEYTQMRTLYPHEFKKAFEAIMEQLRERLRLKNDNYKMVRSMVKKEPTKWTCEICDKQEVELHHEMVRSAVKDHFRERLSDLDGFVINEETGEVYMESTTLTRHISELVHNPELLTPLCNECHQRRH